MYSKWAWTIALLVGFWATMQSTQSGIDLYYAAKFPEAIKVLSPLERNISANTPQEEAVNIRLFLGASYFADGDLTAAKSQFVALYKIDPEYETKSFGSGILNLLKTAQQEVRTACISTCASLSMAIVNRDVGQIYAAAKLLTDQCNCGGGKSKAAQTVFEIAQQHLNNREFVKAQSDFKTAVELDPVLKSKVPGFGSIVVTAVGVGGRLWIDEQPITEELKVNDLPASILLPATNHVVKLVPITPGYKEAVSSVSVIDAQTTAVRLTPQILVVEKKPEVPRSRSIMPRELLDLETGDVFKADISTDLMWFEPTLTALHKAAFAVLPGTATFESITVADLNKLPFRDLSLSKLERGKVIAVRTAEGAYAKVIIESVGSTLTIRWLVFN